MSVAATVGRLAVAVLALAAAGAALPTLAASPAVEPWSDCLRSLGDLASPTIACRAPVILGGPERADLRRASGGVLRDAACTVDIALTRQQVYAALLGARELRVPAQPMTCRLVTTASEPLLARTSVAPQVWFDGGRAVRAAPGMGVVSGVPPVVGDLLGEWVNTSPLIQRQMVDGVNRVLGGAVPR